jgi:Ni/Co efflux regulator RcnB
MAAVALSLLTSSLALADPPGDHRDGDQREWSHDEHGDRDHRDRHHDDRRDGDRRDWHHEDHDRGERRDGDRRDHEDWRGERFDSGYYRRPPGYYRHEWRRGERLPIDYRGPAYLIPNIVVYHLRPPPPGYCWVRVDNNAVLAAVATGVVVDVAYNLFH